MLILQVTLGQVKLKDISMLQYKVTQGSVVEHTRSSFARTLGRSTATNFVALGPMVLARRLSTRN